MYRPSRIKAQDTARDGAVDVWANYCARFQLAPRTLIGACYPGFEQFRVDDQMARDILVALLIKTQDAR